MRVQSTDKWINSISVPNRGIIRKPFNSEVADVSDDVGAWLIEAGFAVTEVVLAIESPSAQAEVILELPGTPAAPVKPKKSSKLFVNPEES